MKQYTKRKNRSHGKCLALCLFVCLFATSCGTTVYTNVGQNVPLFHGKGDVAINGGFSFTNHTNGGGFQLAAAPSDKVAVIASYYGARGSGNGLPTSSSYFEMGAGRYWYRDDTGTTYELLGGVGFGSISNSFSGYYSSGGALDASYTKLFVQPSLGISKKVIELAFTPRIGLVDYSNWSFTTTDAQAMIDMSNFYANRKTNFVFEPGLTLRLGYKAVKLQLQYNYSTFAYATTPAIQVDKDYFSFGLHFLMTNRWQVKK